MRLFRVLDPLRAVAQRRGRFAVMAREPQRPPRVEPAFGRIQVVRRDLVANGERRPRVRLGIGRQSGAGGERDRLIEILRASVIRCARPESVRQPLLP